VATMWLGGSSVVGESRCGVDKLATATVLIVDVNGCDVIVAGGGNMGIGLVVSPGAKV
jgi:hypothetical protein